jgi:hypothetical protein
MILPDKYVRERSSILGQAAYLLSIRRLSMTVSDLWSEIGKADREMSYDSFVLSLDLLYLLGAVDLTDGILRWRERDEN